MKIRNRLWICLATAAVLFSGFLPPPAIAQDNEEYVSILTPDNIKAFLEKSERISMGRSQEMTTDDIAEFFKHHLSDKGSFRSVTSFEMPGTPPTEAEMKYTKDEFIDNVLQGQGLIEDYQTSMEISNLELKNGGKAATLNTVSTETGRLPWPDGEGGQRILPIEGKSECKQKLVVSLSNYIQTADTDCKTRIKFSPFAGKPLGEE
jgi:hypothetical protein